MTYDRFLTETKLSHSLGLYATWLEFYFRLFLKDE